ncbi:MAG: DapH/DapD/GlmU-related protein [Candidatus Electryonea clarkiae]|nr:DapH/DapD/GlmU-related protein [Candidatus Electryonea clarkiae]
MTIRIHPTSDVSKNAIIGDETSIWHQAQIRENVSIGKNCIIGKGVYVDFEVRIGNNVKIQNYVSVFHGVTLEDGVFVGPHVCFTNDLFPRAVNPDGTLKSGDDWELSKTLIKEGAGLGANSTIRCGVTVGKWAIVGAGSVVTRDVPDYGLVWGNPARLHRFVSPSGEELVEKSRTDDVVLATVAGKEEEYSIPLDIWEKTE